MLTISACILSYNRAELLCEALESVLRQTFKPAEILIFDNGSDPRVLDLVRPYLSLGVRWIGSDANYSGIWNFRRAVKTASSDLLFVLHDDDRLCPNFLEEQVEYLSKNPNVGAITCNGYVINIQGQRTGRTLHSHYSDSIVEIYSSAIQVATCYASDRCLPYSPMLYRSEFIRQVPVREEFDMVSDAVFFCDLADLGTIGYQTMPLYECRVHAGQDSSHFPAGQLARLNTYFLTLPGDSDDVARLKQLLMEQYTSRQLRKMWFALNRPLSPQCSQMDISQLQDPLFSVVSALKVCWRAVVKRAGTRLVGLKRKRALHNVSEQAVMVQIKRNLIKLYFFLTEQVGINPLRALASLRGSLAYIRDLRDFRREFTGKLVLNPCLSDRYEEGGSTRNEYFWQDLLVARRIFQSAPKSHVDVGSRIDGFVAHVASFREVEVFDIRQVTATIPGVVFRQADMMAAASVLADVQGYNGYCDSLSCLHAIEHFGLGRYGDNVDVLGYRRGIANLAKLLRPLGRLYLSTPIGRERVEFNANWVFHPQTIVNSAAEVGLQLDELIVLDAQGGSEIFPTPSFEDLRVLGDQHYRLGIFFFTKLGDS